MKAAAQPTTSGLCVALGQICAIVSINNLLVSLQLPSDSTEGALELAGNLRIGPAPYAKLRDVVSFVLRELEVATHVASLSWRKQMLVVSRLSHFFARGLHLLLESTKPNKLLQLSPNRPFTTFGCSRNSYRVDLMWQRNWILCYSSIYMGQSMSYSRLLYDNRGKKMKH